MARFSDNALGSGSSYVVQNLVVGEEVRCRVSLTDGTSSGSSMDSQIATIINSAPTITTATISPNSESLLAAC